MSRHHMTLPPPIYTPPPKAKPSPRRVNVGRVFKRGGIFATNDVDATDEPDEAEGFGRQVGPLAGRSDRDSPTGDEDAQKFKSRPVPVLLSDSTLRVLLEVQELAQPAEETNKVA